MALAAKASTTVVNRLQARSVTKNVVAAVPRSGRVQVGTRCLWALHGGLWMTVHATHDAH